MYLIDYLADKYGISPTMIRALGRDLIEAYHREAFMEGPTSAVMKARMEMGEEACFHLWGLLMEAYYPHVNNEEYLRDARGDWAEFLQRFDHRSVLYGRIMDLWLYDREQNELDKRASRAPENPPSSGPS